MPDPTNQTPTPTPAPGAVDITPQPTAPITADAVIEALFADPAKVDRLMSHPVANAKINAIAASHTARIKPAPPPPAPASQEPKPIDGRVADLEAALAQERQARTALERQRAEEARDRAIEEALRAKGVRPDLMPAAHALLRARALRVGEDGSARLVVTRARAHGQPASTLEYEDIAQGVGDWLADPANAAFLPPPAPLAQRTTRPLAVNPVTGRQVVALPKASSSGAQAAADEAFAQLIANNGGRI